MKITHAAAFTAAALVAASAQAASITGSFVGASDAIGPDNGFTFNGTYLAAKSAFQNAISGAAFGSDSLETLALGGLPANLAYGTTGVTGTLSATGNFLAVPEVVNTDPQSQAGPNGAFARQATDGSQFLYTALGNSNDGALNLTFNPQTVVRGFGFSITDLGDFGSSVTIAFFDGTEETLELSAGNYGLLGTDFQNGDHIWASFTTDEAIASVTVNLIGGTSGDAFSFDEFSILVVPVPPAVAMAGLGLLGVGFARRRAMARA